MIDLDAVLGGSSEAASGDCGCVPSLETARLVVDATECAADGDLATSSACRERTVDALGGAGVDAITVRSKGRVRSYRGAGRALFVAASAFAARISGHDERLASLARRDPLAAAREATGRAGPAATVASTTGLDAFADGARDYADHFDPTVGLAWSHWRVDPTLPADGRLEEVRDLVTGSTARVYTSPDGSTRQYHLEPLARTFDADVVGRLADAYRHLAATGPSASSDAPGRAVDAVARAADPATAMTRVLRKHTRQTGLLRDCFADPALSDVYVTAPATANPLRVRVDGETLETNVYLGAAGVDALASRFRRESGRGFSRASPSLDAATTVGDRRVRVAGVTEPVSDGQAFAFRAHDRDVWTLPALVGNGTMSASAAGLLSIAVERGAALLVAGPRGSGKTTLLGALLWELPASVRTVCIEDAPELPIDTLQDDGRDVQGLRADDAGPLGPAEALRTALRLGDGALVVGEVRGEEAAVLYEAMRVGANSEAVLGTIHGDGAESVLERVVSDLGVPASAFATTDLVVSLETAGPDGDQRRVRTIEEVRDTDPMSFAPLFERDGTGLVATGRIDRGNSRLVSTLTPPDETYAETRTAVQRRAGQLEGESVTARAGAGR